jgi:hypothetical protein
MFVNVAIQSSFEGIHGGFLAGLISTALDMVFYEFPKLYLYRFGDFNESEGFSAKIRGLAIGFQKGDAGWAILEMIFQRGRCVRIQGSFKIITQQIYAFFATNHFFELRV